MDFNDADIEEFFIETPGGFYLKKRFDNSNSGDDRLFYKNQLAEFTAGFRCCLDKLNNIE